MTGKTLLEEQIVLYDTPQAILLADCLLFSPDIPVVRGLVGLKLMETAAFFSDDDLMIPIRWIQEFPELNLFPKSQQDDFYGIDEVVICTMTLTGQRLDVLTKLMWIEDQAYVPLFSVVKELELEVVTHGDTVCIAALGRASHITLDELNSWRQEILTRWVVVENDWRIQLIEISDHHKESTLCSYFWRYLGYGYHALYQSLRSNPEMALLIADNLEYYNIDPIDVRKLVDTTAFYVLSDACYAVVRTGRGTMSNEYLYRLSTTVGATLMASTRVVGTIAEDSEYLYFTEANPFGANSIARIHIASVLAGDAVSPERVGQEGYFYGYGIRDTEDAFSYGRPTGFCLADGYLYSSCVVIGGGIIKDMGFYSVNLSSMQHNKIADGFADQPYISQGWVYYISVMSSNETGLYRMQLDGTSIQEIISVDMNIMSYYVEGSIIAYYCELDENDLPLWLWHTMG